MIAAEFTTTRLPRRQQLEAWRGWHSPVFDVICPGQPVDRGFPATHLHWKLGGLGVSRASSPPNHIERTRAAIRRNPIDHWVVTVNQTTAVEYSVRGSSLKVPAGVPLIFSMADELASTRRGRDSVQCLFFLSRDVFGGIAALLDAACGAVLATPEGKLLADYITVLVKRLPELSPRDGSRLVTAVEAMVSACLAPSPDRLASAEKPIALTLRERVRRAVRTNLRSPLLGPDRLCREAGTSRSQLYRLLESEGGVAHYIRRQRLSQSFTLLCDATNLLPVAKIAEALCFTDASSFSRAFRREFGMSPSDARMASVAGPRLPKVAEPRGASGFSDCLRGL